MYATWTLMNYCFELFSFYYSLQRSVFWTLFITLVLLLVYIYTCVLNEFLSICYLDIYIYENKYRMTPKDDIQCSTKVLWILNLPELTNIIDTSNSPIQCWQACNTVATINTLFSKKRQISLRLSRFRNTRLVNWLQIKQYIFLYIYVHDKSAECIKCLTKIESNSGYF